MKILKALVFLLVLSSCTEMAESDSPVPQAMRLAVQAEIESPPVLQAEPEPAPTAPPLPVEPEKPKAETVAIEKGYLPRLVVFTAPDWCGPCQVLDRNLLMLGQLAYQDKDGSQHLWGEKIGCTEDYAIQIVDASDPDGEGAKTADRYLISQFPTIMRIDRDGKRESQFTGVLDAETLCRYQAGKWAPPHKLSEIVQGGKP